MKKVVKKAAPKKVAPKKKVAPAKGAWVPPWAKKAVEEKKTGEKYASKAAMAKHEKGESKKMRMMEGEIPMAKKGGKAKKSCSCGKASCMMCGGKKYGDGGLTGIELKRRGQANKRLGASMKLEGQSKKSLGQLMKAAGIRKKKEGMAMQSMRNGGKK
jgi:hypothetical protein